MNTDLQNKVVINHSYVFYKPNRNGKYSNDLSKLVSFYKISVCIE